MEKSSWFGSCRCMVLALFCLLAAASVSVAAEFSADLVLTEKGGEEMMGKIYVKGDKVRHELSEEGETQIMIIRPDKSLSWMITPEEKSYMEIPYQADERAFDEWSPEMEKKAKFLGEETVSGFPSKKYEITEDGEKVTYWVSKKFSFPIKVEDEETVMEYRNIKDGPLEDSLFEVPAGHEKMDMPEMSEEEEEAGP